MPQGRVQQERRVPVRSMRRQDCNQDELQQLSQGARRVPAGLVQTAVPTAPSKLQPALLKPALLHLALPVQQFNSALLTIPAIGHVADISPETCEPMCTHVPARP